MSNVRYGAEQIKKKNVRFVMEKSLPENQNSSNQNKNKNIPYFQQKSIINPNPNSYNLKEKSQQPEYLSCDDNDLLVEPEEDIYKQQEPDFKNPEDYHLSEGEKMKKLIDLKGTGYTTTTVFKNKYEKKPAIHNPTMQRRLAVTSYQTEGDPKNAGQVSNVSIYQLQMAKQEESRNKWIKKQQDEFRKNEALYEQFLKNQK